MYVSKPRCNEIYKDYRKIYNISRTLVGNKIVDHTNVVEAAPTGLFLTQHMASMDWANITTGWNEKHFSFGICYVLY